MGGAEQRQPGHAHQRSSAALRPVASTANYVSGSSGIDTSVTGYGYASFLLGAADQISGFSLAYAPTQYTRAKLAAPYVEDHWKVNKKLVVNLGLRWDYIPPVHENAIKLPTGNFTFSYLDPNTINPATGTPGVLAFAGSYGNGCNCKTPMQTYYKNWGPRIGLVYSVNDKTVFRTSFGLTYDQGGGTGGGQLSGGVGGANSSGQILGSSTTATSPSAVTSGVNAGPSFWLGTRPIWEPMRIPRSSAPAMPIPAHPLPASQPRSWTLAITESTGTAVVPPAPWDTTTSINLDAPRSTPSTTSALSGPSPRT